MNPWHSILSRRQSSFSRTFNTMHSNAGAGRSQDICKDHSADGCAGCSYPLGLEQVRRGGSAQVKDVPSKDAPQKQLQALAVILYGIQLPVKHQAVMKPPGKNYLSLKWRACVLMPYCYEKIHLQT